MATITETGTGGLVSGTSLTTYGRIITKTASGGIKVGCPYTKAYTAQPRTSGGLRLGSTSEYIQDNFHHTPFESIFGHNGYRYRKRITIPQKTVNTEIVNVPILFTATLNPAHLMTGYDIRFEDTEENVLKYEVVSCNISTGAIIAYVKIPSITTSETHFFVYYGKERGRLRRAFSSGFSSGFEIGQFESLIFSGETPFGADFASVYHLIEDGLSTNYKDSGIYNFDADDNGVATSTPTRVTGRLSYAQQFSGDDYLTADVNAAVNMVSFWYKRTGPIGYKAAVYSKGITDIVNNSGWQVAVGVDVDNKAFLAVQTSEVSWTTTITKGTTAFALNTWYYVTAKFNGSVNEVWVNGVLETHVDHSATMITDGFQDSFIGRWDGTNYITGLVEELRVYETAFNDAYIAFDYANQANPSYIIGSEATSLELGGVAPIQANYIANLPTGGITFGGAAPAGQLVGTFVGSGGITFGGTAPSSIEFPFTASGGITFGGSGSVTIVYDFIASGGIVFDGSAPAISTANYSHTASGGITFGGTGIPTLDFSHTASGGIAFGGTAASQASYNFVSSGGTVFGGTATASVVAQYYGSGGILFGGIAPYSIAYAYAGMGGITFGGSASLANSYNFIPTGGVAFAGASPVKANYVHTVSGGIVFGGNAGVQVNYIVAPCDCDCD